MKFTCTSIVQSETILSFERQPWRIGALSRPRGLDLTQRRQGAKGSETIVPRLILGTYASAQALTLRAFSLRHRCVQCALCRRRPQRSHAHDPCPRSQSNSSGESPVRRLPVSRHRPRRAVATNSRRRSEGSEVNWAWADSSRSRRTPDPRNR